MAQCNSITRKGTRCTRNALPRSKYCWQHNTPFVLTFFAATGVLVTVFLTGIGFWADLLTVLPTFVIPQHEGRVSGRSQSSLSLYENRITRGQDAKRIGQDDEALNYFTQALEIARAEGDRSKEGLALNEIGTVYDDKGQYDEALEFYNQALVIRREVKDRSGEGSTLNNIGAAYDHKGQYDQALEYYRQALVIRREVKDRPGEGSTLNNIGATYHHQ